MTLIPSKQEAQSRGKEPDLVGDLLDVEKRHEHALVQPETLSSRLVSGYLNFYLQNFFKYLIANW